MKFNSYSGGHAVLARTPQDTEKLLIGGRRVAASSGRNFETFNPATGKLIARPGTPLTCGLKTGTVWVNTYGVTDIQLPWGGARDSGSGRVQGDAAIENVTESKAVWVNTAG